MHHPESSQIQLDYPADPQDLYTYYHLSYWRNTQQAHTHITDILEVILQMRHMIRLLYLLLVFMMVILMKSHIVPLAEEL